MRNTILALLMMFGLPGAAFAQGTPVTLFNAETGWAVASNTVFASNGLPLAYNAAFDPNTSTAADYVIMGDGSSSTFGPLAYTPGATEQWTETTAPVAWTTANISFAANSYTKTVVENTSALPCLRNNAAAEYDLFLGPNSYDKGTNVVSAVNVAYRANAALVPSLAQLESLVISGRATINSVSQPFTPAACAVNHASVGFNLSFVDRITNQHFQYTLHLASLCFPGPDYTSCTHQLKNPASWYQAGIVTAVTDTPVGLSPALTIVPSGQAPITMPLTGTGIVTLSSLNLLSRIETLLQTNPANLDQNVSDWQLSGLSYGTNMWGDSAVTTTWQGLNAAATCKNANCS